MTGKPAALTRRRAWNFRHLPGRRVRSGAGALAFVNTVGCC